MPTVSQSDNPNVTKTSPGLMMDEFIPLVSFEKDGLKVINPAKLIFEHEEEEIAYNDKEDHELSEHIDNEHKRIYRVYQRTTSEKEKISFPFSITKGNKDSDDDDGIITVRLSEEIEGVTITSEQEFTATYDSKYNLELELKLEEPKEFYIDFYAKDDEDDEWNIGELKNVHCGRVKIVVHYKNEWEFDKTQIAKIRKYAIANNLKYNGPGDQNRYHHCTDTHKHIIYKLLDKPSGLDLGKDQNHEAVRLVPKDFEKAGESTTDGVRSKLISSTYAETSKTFTVMDTDNNEVIYNGKAGNTDKDLIGFKESPIEYMKSKCPDDGFYCFIGAYNADYHSFTIIVNKSGSKFSFEFIDQIFGVSSKKGAELEDFFLTYIQAWKSNFPMKLELYQLRNKKK